MTIHLIAIAFAGALAVGSSSGQITWTNFSGAPQEGSVDGPGDEARFNEPDGIAVDRQGFVFVSDSGNQTIRRISPTGVVSTLAGKASEWGNADGQGDEARFSTPRGLTVDFSGNIFVADRSNHTIRKITPGGQVSTFAGLAGNSGLANGIGSAARFNNPMDVAIDPSGVLYVGEFNGTSIRRISPDGRVTTYLGNSPTSNAPFIPSGSYFDIPIELAAHSDGTLFAIEYNRSRIFKILPDNEHSVFAGGLVGGGVYHLDGVGTSVRFNRPSGIATDAKGNLYVADTHNHVIRKCTPNGSVSTVGGLPGQSGHEFGSGAAARFNLPSNIAVGPDGAIYVANKLGHNIIRGVVSGPEIEVSRTSGLDAPTWVHSADKHRFGPTSLGSTSRVRLEIGNEGLSDLSVSSVQITGTHASEFTHSASPSGVLAPGDTAFLEISFVPTATGEKTARLEIASSDADETVFVINLVGRAVPESPSGPLWWGWQAGSLAEQSGYTNGKVEAARFNQPRGIAISRDGTLFVADTNNHAVRKITRDGVVSTLAGQVTAPGSVNGLSGYARFRSPKAIAVDDQGNIYVADTSNHIVRKITSEGLTTTFAGLAGTSGSADGQAPEARFNSPAGIAFDAASGRLIVADTANHTLRAISVTGEVSTLAGTAQTPGAADGPAHSASFRSPSGIAVATDGAIWICDTGNHTIRRLSTNAEVSTVAGLAGTSGSTDAQGGDARFKSPAALALDGEGNCHVADRENRTIRKIDPAGNVSTSGGLATVFGAVEGLGGDARLASPEGIALSPEGRLFVANTGRHHLFTSTIIGSDIVLFRDDGTAVPPLSHEEFEAPRLGTHRRGYFVANTGSVDLSNIGAELMGEDLSRFGIEGNLPSILGPGETAPFGIRFSPTAVGPASASLSLVSDDPDENPVEITFDALALAPRDHWRKTFFLTPTNSGDAADDQDPDKDGIPNLEEYAYGLNPLASEMQRSESLPRPSLIQTPDGPRLRLEYLRRKPSSLPDIRYTVEFGSNLANGGPDGMQASGETEEIVEVDSLWERVVVGDMSGEGSPARFGRVRVDPE